jgi:long-chain acyl-CoA synthetase
VIELTARLASLLDDAPAGAEAVAFEGTWWTWGDLRRISRGVEAAFASVGLGAGVRVGVVLENRPEHLAVILAVIGGGRCLTTLNPLQPGDRLVADIGRAATPIVFASAAILERHGVLESIRAHGTVVVLASDGSMTVDDTAPMTGQSRYADRDTAVEMLTSGTTGPPKRVRLTRGQLDVSLDSAHVRAKAIDGKPVLGSGVSMVSTPLVHIGGLWGALSAAFAGRRIVLLDRFRLEEWVAAIETYRPARARPGSFRRRCAASSRRLSSRAACRACRWSPRALRRVRRILPMHSPTATASRC